MNIQENISLKPFNTFGIEATAKYFIEITSIEELKALLKTAIFSTNERLILGGGSNILLTKDFDGIVVKIAIKGIEIVKNTPEEVLIKAYSGEVWHDLVLYCVNKNIKGGIENLSLIPGCVGASPMQNIGAYGVEIKDIFYELEALHISSGEIQKFNLTQCEFGYRESVFKRKLKGQYIILAVTYVLNQQKELNLSYGAIGETITNAGIQDITVKTVSDTVIQIRQSKLPNPAEIGNAGSFFKNPEIPTSQFENLKQQYPTLPAYPTKEGFTKIPAGWLIEQAGWKGKVIGNTGVHKNQALVLVNYGQATGNEIKNLAFEVIASVKEKYGIELENEVNFV